MSTKAFQISVDFDIHAVSCPGVWLCQNGDVMLRIEMLGFLKHTKRVEPIFPLLLHEQFSFHKAFPSIGTLKGLHDELQKCNIHLDLIQWCTDSLKTIVLASFKGSLAEVLYPSPLDKGLVAGVDVDLLMETTKYFPGIIAPKVEISTRMVIEEMANYPVSGYSRLLNPMTVSSKKLYKKTSEHLTLPKTDEEKGSITYNNKGTYIQKKVQKPVCHAKQKNKCYCSKNSMIKREDKIKKNESEGVRKTINSECDTIMKYCACRPCRTVKSKHEANYKKETVTCRFGEIKSEECCDVCHKYEDYFKHFYNKSENQSLDHTDSCSGFSSHKTRAVGSDYSAFLKSVRNDCPCICWKGTLTGQKSCKKKELHISADASHKYDSSIDTNRLVSYGDLESYYHKLYERVCKNINSEQTHM